MEKNPFAVKVDVQNELKNRIYYNGLEIQRLLQSNDISYKDSVDKIIVLLGENTLLLNSVDLLENYIPTPQTNG